MIGNPIDRGQMHLGDTLSEPIEALRIVDDYYFYKAIEIIRERGREFTEKRSVALRTDGGGLLTGIHFIAPSAASAYVSIIAKRSAIRGTASRHIIGTYTAATARRIAKTPVPDSQRTTPRRLKKPYSAFVRSFFARIRRLPEDAQVKAAMRREENTQAKALKDAEAAIEKASKAVAVWKMKR